MTRPPAFDGAEIECAEPDCKASVPGHRWGKVKAVGWFFQRDGTAWCPEHIPGWVEEWRRRRDDGC